MELTLGTIRRKLLLKKEALLCLNVHVAVVPQFVKGHGLSRVIIQDSEFGGMSISNICALLLNSEVIGLLLLWVRNFQVRARGELYLPKLELGLVRPKKVAQSAWRQTRDYLKIVKGLVIQIGRADDLAFRTPLRGLLSLSKSLGSEMAKSANRAIKLARTDEPWMCIILTGINRTAPRQISLRSVIPATSDGTWVRTSLWSVILSKFRSLFRRRHRQGAQDITSSRLNALSCTTPGLASKKYSANSAVMLPSSIFSRKLGIQFVPCQNPSSFAAQRSAA